MATCQSRPSRISNNTLKTPTYFDFYPWPRSGYGHIELFMAQYLGASQSSQNLRASYAYPSHRLPASVSSASLLLPHSASFQSFGHGSKARSSGTWTTSSGELGLLNNADEVEDRDVFVQEYNRLAKKVSSFTMKSAKCTLMLCRSRLLRPLLGYVFDEC